MIFCLKIIGTFLLVLSLNSCLETTPQITNGSSGGKLAATELESKDKKIQEIQILYKIVEKSSMDAATKASIEARLNAALAALNDPNLDSAGLNKVIADLSTINDDIAKVTGTSTTAAAPDTSPPPALSVFSGATGTASAAIDLTITYPGNVSDYDIVVIRRSTGASAPTDCSSGTSVKTYTSFANVVYTDITPSGGTAYSYRACIYDAAGNLTSSNTATNITSYSFSHSMFVTSIAYNGNLGGFAGADAKCMAAASGASLSGTWRAIISSKYGNAKDRIVIQGTVYNQLGAVVATSKNDLWDGVITNAANYNETGAGSGTSTWTATVSSGAYQVTNGDCNNWTDGTASYSAEFAWPAFTSSSWIDNGQVNCSTSNSIYCISQPPGFDLTAFSATTGSGSNGDIAVTITFPATSTQFQTVDVRRIAGATPPSSDCASDGTVVKTFSTGGFTSQTFTDATGGAGLQYSYRACVYDTAGTLQSSSYAAKVIAKGTTHTIFVTTTTYTGNFGGPAGADVQCAARATVAGLTNAANYKAVISATGVAANSRITINGPIYNMNGDLIASNLGDLWDGTISNPVKYTELNTVATTYPWTGTIASGIADSQTCSDWTSASGAIGGGLGDRSLTNSGWINSGSYPVCNTTYALYCISQ